MRLMRVATSPLSSRGSLRGTPVADSPHGASPKRLDGGTSSLPSASLRRQGVGPTASAAKSRESHKPARRPDKEAASERRARNVAGIAPTAEHKRVRASTEDEPFVASLPVASCFSSADTTASSSLAPTSVEAEGSLPLRPPAHGEALSTSVASERRSVSEGETILLPAFERRSLSVVSLRSSGQTGAHTPAHTGTHTPAHTGTSTPAHPHSDIREGSKEGVGEFVRVIARVRPPLPSEVSGRSLEDAGDGVVVFADGKNLVVRDGSSAGSRQRQFAMDVVVDSRTLSGSQQAFYEEVGVGLVEQSLKGFNVCVFAYGHTGSGKTYTMIGAGNSLLPGITGESAGLLPRFLRALHTKLSERCAEECQYGCEFIEVYNERIRDLLAPPGMVGQSRERVVHVHPKHGVTVAGLKKSIVSDADQALDLVQFGNQMRTVAATTMNTRSSRSHAIFSMSFSWPGAVAGTSTSSTVTFVDLAGREDQGTSSGQAILFREMVCINTSLFHLANVINKIAEGATQAGSLKDFRNSKLTLLLSQALIGNSRTLLVATLSPIRSMYEENCSTLSFAQGVKKIQTRPVVNDKSTRAVALELEAEVMALRRELSMAQSGSSEKDQQLHDAEALIAEYKRTLEEQKLQSEALHLLRERAKLTLGLGRADNPEIPYLTNLNADPALQGVCQYYLAKDGLLVGSDSSLCDMVLNGVGIAPVMARLRVDSHWRNPTVELCRPSGEAELPRVVVNGVALEADEPQPLENGDALAFGFAHSFRFVIPSQDRRDASDVMLESKDLGMMSKMLSGYDFCGRNAKAAKPFLTHLKASRSSQVVLRFADALNKVVPLVEEANMITREVRPGDGFRFDLHVINGVFEFLSRVPELVVCVLWDPQVVRARPAQTLVGPSRVTFGLPQRLPQAEPLMERVLSTTSQCGGKNPWTPLVNELGLDESLHSAKDGELLLYVWALEKFLGRLGLMREVYEEGEAASCCFDEILSKLRKQPELDPWLEASVQVRPEDPLDTPASGTSRKYRRLASFGANVKASIMAAANRAAEVPTDDGISDEDVESSTQSRASVASASLKNPGEGVAETGSETTCTPVVGWSPPREGSLKELTTRARARNGFESVCEALAPPPSTSPGSRAGAPEDAHSPGDVPPSSLPQAHERQQALGHAKGILPTHHPSFRKDLDLAHDLVRVTEQRDRLASLLAELIQQTKKSEDGKLSDATRMRFADATTAIIKDDVSHSIRTHSASSGTSSAPTSICVVRESTAPVTAPPPAVRTLRRLASLNSIVTAAVVAGVPELRSLSPDRHSQSVGVLHTLAKSDSRVQIGIPRVMPRTPVRMSTSPVRSPARKEAPLVVLQSNCRSGSCSPGPVTIGRGAPPPIAGAPPVTGSLVPSASQKSLSIAGARCSFCGQPPGSCLPCVGSPPSHGFVTRMVSTSYTTCVVASESLHAVSV